MSGTDETVEAEAPADDIRSLLDAAVTESEAPRDPPQTDAKPAEGETRARGPDGKFVRAEPGDEAQSPPDRKPGAALADPVKAPDAPKLPDDTFDKATAKWSAADKEMLKGLPPQAQEFMLRRERDREADYTRKTQDAAAFRRDYEPIQQMFAPHAETLRQKGLTPAATIQGWMQVEQAFVQGRGAEQIKRIVDAYRINPADVVRALGVAGAQAPTEPGQPEPAPGSQPIQLPPEIAAKLTRLEGWQAQQDHERQRVAEAQYNERAAHVMASIDKFATETDSTGGLLHPHFRDVEDEMTRLSLAAQAAGQKPPTLESLYDAAVWANPTTRARLLDERHAAAEAQRAADEQKARDEARAKAQRARRASVSVTGAPGSGQPPTAREGDRSLRQQLEDAASEFEQA